MTSPKRRGLCIHFFVVTGVAANLKAVCVQLAHFVPGHLRAILEYEIATNDAQLKLFVRDGYEWARQPMLARIGYVGDGQRCRPLCRRGCHT